MHLPNHHLFKKVLVIRRYISGHYSFITCIRTLPSSSIFIFLKISKKTFHLFLSQPLKYLFIALKYQWSSFFCNTSAMAEDNIDLIRLGLVSQVVSVRRERAAVRTTRPRVANNSFDLRGVT